MIITRPAYDAMLAHARAAMPDEACGFLAGRDHVTHFLPLDNAADMPRTQFESSPRSTLAAYRRMRELNLELLAVYHSHPTSPPAPSETDKERHNLPGVLCVIVSPLTDAVAAWDMEQGREVTIQIECP
ncbi:MAG: M67 family metallopeptidase [Gemmataceae bacterium]|nr:M67 family metallopeptidase [Gemmataceae bacterium]